MPRFVIQQHTVSPGDIHYDLMLEREGVLKTWRLKDPQGAVDGSDVDLEAIQDHRLYYLDYEGEISDGHGSVKIWDRGTYEAKWGEVGRVLITFAGLRLTGSRILAAVGDPAARRLSRFLTE